MLNIICVTLNKKARSMMGGELGSRYVGLDVIFIIPSIGLD